MNGFGIPCSPSIIAPTGGCKHCRVTAFPGEYPSSVACLSPRDYLSANFDPEVVGPPGTCWLFTIADLDIACGPNVPHAVWWLQFIEALGFYVWVVPVRWIRANVIGTIGSDEGFVHALSLDAGSDTSWVDAAALSDIAITVAGVWNAFMLEFATIFPTSVSYREVACSLLQQTTVGGDIDTILTSEFAPINSGFGQPGTSTAQQVPNEVSMAISWETGTRGRRGRGRTYLPPMIATILTGEGRWGSGVPEEIANYAFETLIPGLNGGGSTWRLAVRSGADLALYDVTGARVSDVPDSQRRRRRSQVPVFHEGA